MKWLVTLILTFCAIAERVQCDLVVSPVSTADYISKDIVFQCTGNPDNETVHPYTWQYNPMSHNPVVIVYDCQVNPAYAGYYSTEVTEDGGCNLIIHRITMQSAGTYTCQHWYDQGSAELITLNTNSNCDFGPYDLISGEFVEIRCFLNYNGSIAPRMDFKSETGAIYNNATINTFTNQVNGRVSFPVYPPTTRAATANAYFPIPITFRFTWTLPTLMVQFPVTNVVVDIESDFECDTYANFTRLACSAQGFPEPTIEWWDLKTGEVFRTTTITLYNEGENEFTCRAINEIRGTVFIQDRNVALNVSGDEPTTCPPSVTPPEPTTTTPEPTTTTTEPTTTTTEAIPVTECGSILHVAPSEASISPGYNRMCYISRQNDSAYLTTQCRALIQHLPPDIGDYTTLLQRGGNFGCSITTRTDYVGANNACFDGFQQTITLGAVQTSTRLYVCIKLPPGGRTAV